MFVYIHYNKFHTGIICSEITPNVFTSIPGAGRDREMCVGVPGSVAGKAHGSTINGAFPDLRIGAETIHRTTGPISNGTIQPRHRVFWGSVKFLTHDNFLLNFGMYEL